LLCTNRLASFIASLFVHNNILPVSIIMFVLAVIGLSAIRLIGRGGAAEDDGVTG
jgi:hypothetical protein